jgi:hypothetical protein
MLSHVVATTNLQNKKNSFHNIWCVQKIIPIFAQQKIEMRQMQLHINTEVRFSHKGDYTGRGACFAIG